MPSSQPEPTPMDTLRTKWTILYRTTLPFLAKSRSPSQPSWPVSLDHCFARIILDNTIGQSAGPNGENLQWDKVIGKPAVRNMSEEQLGRAIELGEKIVSGEVDLVELDEWSLDARGKTKVNRKRKVVDGVGETREDGEESKRRKVVRGNEAEEEIGDSGKQIERQVKGSKDNKKRQTQSTLSFQSSEPKQLPSPTSSETETADTSSKKAITINNQTSDISHDSTLSQETILSTLYKIQSHPSLTPFRKRLYTSLFSVPTGQHTTYAALAAHLGSVPRAVGNGMRNNPFAPTVPCHRVLASDRTLGGFFGDWGVDGKHGNEKIKLLDGEGVTFNSGGKVKGMVWKGFWDLGDFEREFGKVK